MNKKEEEKKNEDKNSNEEDEQKKIILIKGKVFNSLKRIKINTDAKKRILSKILKYKFNKC